MRLADKCETQFPAAWSTMVTQEQGRCGESMAFDIYDPPSGRTRRWVRRRDNQARMPGWARILIVILCAAMLGTVAWQYAARLMQPTRKSPAIETATKTTLPAHAEWQTEVSNSLEVAAREASAGDITQAEVAMDRAVAFVTAARIKSQASKPEFFEAAIGQLERIVATHPENGRLREHAALMQLELAELRSSVEPAPTQSGNLNRVAINSPREIGRDATLDPGSLGESTLDASLMPSSSEILEPPSTRLFADNVRVEDLTIRGAAQTIDGMHWKNVTFIGTRLRYEGGEVDLQNVRFVRCTFGFTTDERGARLATAIARGQSSIVIE